MTPVLLHEATRILQPAPATHLDTARALCHDPRRPLATVLLLAGAEGAHVPVGGVVARIVLPAIGSTAMAS